ncbi:MAG: hypothetical protein PVF68_01765 [Acidobacteriota bacterium]
MKIVKRILVGCLGLAVLLVVGLAVTAGIMVALGPPESRPGQPANVAEALPGAGTLPVPDPAPGEVPLPRGRARVELHLEEGEFDVRPGRPGEGVRVEGDYDPGLYEFVHEVTGDEDDPVVRISLRSRYSMLRRLLTLGDMEEFENRLTIYLPPDVDLSLDCTISKGTSNLDLSGLALSALDLDLSMGEHDLRMDEPNPIAMEDLRVQLSMGEFSARKLGNARFRSARIEGSMGEMRVDLTGAYVQDAEVRAGFSMGEASLRLPSDIDVDLSRRVVFGEASGGRKPEREIPAGAPHLVVVGSMTLGELRVTWD